MKAAEVVPVEALNNPALEAQAPPLDPKEVVEQVEQVTQRTRKEIAAELYADYQAKKEGALEALLAYKKSAKVSWEKLGIPDPGDVLGTVAQTQPEAKPAALAKQTKVKPKKQASQTVTGVVTGEGSFRERIQKLLAIGLTSVGVAQAVLSLKKQSKKSWATLGVSDAQVEEITRLTQ